VVVFVYLFGYGEGGGCGLEVVVGGDCYDVYV